MNNQNIQPLVELQALDLKIHALEESKNSQPQIISDKENELKTLQEKLAGHQEAQKKLKMEVDGKNLALREKEEKIAKLNVQLNTTKTNKEYSALLNEIGSLQADKSVLEDEILGLFTKSEDTQSAAINKEIDKARQNLETARQEAEQVIASITKSLEELYAKRETFSTAIPANILATYQHISNHKSDKVAIAQVVDETCQGCFMNITPQEINDIMKGKEIIKCRSCSRILYL